VLQREIQAVEQVLAKIGAAAAGDPILQSCHARIAAAIADSNQIEARARAIAESLAVLAAAVELREHVPGVVSDPFTATRIAGSARHTYGQGIERADVRGILARALPADA
jgi:putative acyl-CoA dehydrogenase